MPAEITSAAPAAAPLNGESLRAAGQRRSPMIRPPVALEQAALRFLPAETVLKLQIVPYRLTASTMAVASATRAPDELARELTIETRLGVEVTWSPPDEIAMALAAVLTPDSAQATAEAQANAWLRALGEGRSIGAQSGEAQAAVARRQRLEAFSLATGRPVLDLTRWRHNAALAPLVPTELARTHNAVPVFAIGGVLLVAVAAGSQELAGAGWHEVAASVATATGLTVQVALAEPAAVQRLLVELYSPRPVRHTTTDTPAPAEGGGSVFGAAARRAMRATGLRSDADALGMGRGGPVNLAGVRPDPLLLARLPRQIAERFHCLPLDEERNVLRIAAPSDAPPTLGLMLAEVIGQPVRLAPAPRHEVEQAVRRLYDTKQPARSDARLPQLGAYLVHGGLISSGQLEQALAEQAKTGEFLGRLLVRSGAVSEEMLLEALALRQDTPAVHLANTLPDTEVVRLIPEDLARAERVLALRRQDDVLHAAMADPGSDITLSAVERATGLKVRPFLSEEDDILSAVGRLYRSGTRAVTGEVERFLGWLIAQRVITRPQYLQVYARFSAGAPIDEALIAAAGFSAERVAELLAQATSLPRRDLWPRDELVQVFDALGAQATQHRYVDPVDPVATRRITFQAAERATALTVAIEGDRVIVAVADPLDSAGMAELRTAITGRYDLVVSTREAIRAAIRRTIGRRQVGDYLLAAGIVSREELDRALGLARSTRVRLGKALLTLGYITQEQLSLYLSEQFDLPFFDLDSASIDETAARAIPEEMARRGGVLPLAMDDRHALVALVDPTDTQLIEEVRETLDREITTVLVTERQMEAALQSIYRAEYVQRASLELLSRSPEDSAAKTWTRAQLIWIFGIISLTLVGLAIKPIPTLIAIMGFCSAFYFSLSAYKLFLIYRSLAGTLEETITDEEVAALDDRDLPVYTVLVPVYKEPDVLPILLEALTKFDYPRTKLDVILLLEDDDKETQAVVNDMRLPEGFRALVVPFMRPKTKPKACNYGLLHAEGEFLVIYDAEDVPEPDQLKKAVIVFRRWDDRLACIQSKLNYFNRDQNLLTRWFTVEYSMWFDLLLPGLDNSGAPIPLGGTSNHFRTELLRELGGWDPFNTTEDADLGLRIFKRGYRTVVMNSTTYEEANSNLYNWIRQRSRWVKGYMQTWLVHMRHPIKLYREIGFHAFFSFQMIIGGTCFALMANPVFWLITALWFLTQWSVIQAIFPGPVFYLGAIGLYVGNFAFVYINVSGALRREYYHLVKYALLTPLYWGLMSIAAWQAFRELIFKPHYWQKTQHGLFKGKARVPVTRRPAQ